MHDKIQYFFPSICEISSENATSYSCEKVLLMYAGFQADLFTSLLLGKIQSNTSLMKTLICLPVTFCEVFSKLVHPLHEEVRAVM